MNYLLKHKYLNDFYINRFMNSKDWEYTWSNNFFLFINKIYGIFFWRNLLYLLKDIKLNSNTNIIELGCGTGESLLKLVKKCGCKATLVDYCKSTLEKTSKNFKKNKIKANFIFKDIFNFDFRKKYSLTLSMGLIEHFQGKKRIKLFKIHKDLTKKNGYVVVYVPRSSFLYWSIRKANKVISRYFTPEIPFTKNELLDMCKINNLVPIKITKPLFGSWLSLLAKRQ